MKLVFFTQEDPFYVRHFFDEFFKIYPHHEEIQAVVLSSPMGKRSKAHLAAQMYSFYGLCNFLKVGVRYVIYHLLDKLPFTSSRSYTVAGLCQSLNIKVIERNDLNSRDFIKLVKAYDADLFISVASPIIFRRELIDTPKLDCINIHAAPLPKYRGMLPNFWQLFNNERSAGLTVHKIDSGIDTGDIIEQIFVPISDGESLNALIIKMKREGAHLIDKVIEEFRIGKVTYKPMKGEGSYFSFPTRNDVLEFMHRGHRIF